MVTVRKPAPWLLTFTPGSATLPLQYGDFAQWHNAWLQGPELERQQEYWLKQLKPPLATLDLVESGLMANAVTNDVCDPISGMPEFKVCAVSIARADLFAPTDEGVLV